MSHRVLGDRVAWSSTEHLLAAAVDALRGANWQRSGDKHAPRPKPIPRPGDPIVQRLTGKELDARLLEQKRRHRRRRKR